MSLNFADGEVITLDLCEECAAKFEREKSWFRGSPPREAIGQMISTLYRPIDGAPVLTKQGMGWFQRNKTEPAARYTCLPRG